MALTKEDLQAISGLLDVKLQPIENRLGRLEADVSAVKKGQAEMIGDIIKLDRKISDAYQLALDAWGQSMENRSWLEQGRLQA